MGCCWSPCSSSSSSDSPIDKVRIVHLNGYIEDFTFPVTVSQIASQSTNHLVCTAAQLLVKGTSPLKPDALLQPGHIYFLLPFSALEADASPLELSSLVKNLTAKANTSSICRKYQTSSSRLCPRKSSWRPILDTIREMSFNRRCESDSYSEQGL